MTIELIQRLCHHADVRPSAEAMRQIGPAGAVDRVMTYGQLCRAVADLTERFLSEFPPGAVIILSHANELELVVVFLSVLSAGATVFPVHPSLTEPELRAAADCSGAFAVSGTPEAVDILSRWGAVPVDVQTAVNRTLGASTDMKSPAVLKANQRLLELQPNSIVGPELLLQSSGTSGRPKTVRRRGAGLDAVARSVAKSIVLGSEDRVLGLIPACHSYGVEHLMLAPIFAGACVHFCRGFEPQVVLQQLDAGGITVFPGVPSMFEMLTRSIADNRNFQSLRCAYSAGAILPPAVAILFEQRTGVRLGQLFGMTEIGSVTFNDPSGPDYNPTSSGLPMDGVQIRILDPDATDASHPLPAGIDGEIAISGPCLLAGYVHGPDHPCEPAEELVDGFFRTGDHGHVDRFGRLTVTGRLKLVVDIGGLKVNLLEVEHVLQSHSGVRDCAVVAMPVSETVSRLKAFVVPTEAGHPPSSADLRNHLRSQLSAHKVPRVFEFCATIPRTATGKILRHRLR